MSKNNSDAIERYALEAVPQSDRQPWFTIALIWIGTMICVPGLMIGGALITGLTVMQAFWAGVIGYSIVVLYMSFQGMQAADLGRPTVSLASSSFGETGSRVVISFVLGIATLGWFGVQANLCGVAFSNILASWLGINLPVWISSLIWGVIMLTTAIYGFNALKYLNYIAVPSLIILSLYGTFISLSTYGSDILFSYQPPQPFPFIQGVALAVGTFAVGGVIAGDYSRYAVGRKDAILSSVLGVLPAGVGMLVMGGVMAVVAGTYDITVILANLGVPLIGLIVLILATWTTNTVNAYSGGLAITNMFNLGDSNRALATGIAGALGTLLAIAGIIDYFINYLLVLTSAIPAVAGVMIADYWIVKKGDASKWNKVPGVNWVGIISWLLGVVAGNVIKVGVGPLSGIVVSLVAYIILHSLVAYIILHSFVAKEEQSK